MSNFLVNSVNNVLASENDDKLRQSNRQWAQVKQQRRLNNQKHQRQKQFEEQDSQNSNVLNKFKSNQLLNGNQLAEASKFASNIKKNLVDNAGKSKNATTQRRKLIDATANTFLDIDELNVLLDVFEQDQDFIRNLEDVSHDVIETKDGTEVDLINRYIQKYKLSTSQIYFLLCSLLAKLHADGRKLSFIDRLSQWKRDFEAEQSAFLFQFFRLHDNISLMKDQSGKISSENLSKYAEFASSDNSPSSLKDVIKLIGDALDSQFNTIVSVYVKICVYQLQLLSKQRLNAEDKSELSTFVNLEKLVLVVKSLHVKQNQLYNKLQVYGILQSTDKDFSQSRALIATETFCKSSFISDLTLGRLVADWQINEPSLDKYPRFLNDLIEFCRSLPLIVFDNELANVHKIVSGIRNILVEKSQMLEEKSTNVQANCQLDIFKKSKATIIKYT